MRTFRITGAYKLYLDKFYARRPALGGCDYETQLAALIHDAFGWSGVWETALAPLGVELKSGVSNAHHLQRAWARENLGSEQHSPMDILAEQVRRFAPDLLFIEDFSAVTRAWLEHIRSSCPSIRAVVGWCGAPYGQVDIFSAFDLLLTNIPDLVGHFRSKGVEAVHFRHAFDPRVLERIDLARPKAFNLTFVGQVALGNKQHNARLRLLRRIAKRHRLDLFSPLADRSVWSEVKQVIALIWWLSLAGIMAAGVPKKFLNSIPFVRRPFYWGGQPSAIDLSHRFVFRHLHPSVFGLAMFQTLRDSQITLNSHIDLAGDSASNMRLFEATGVGTCLLTDWKSDLKEIFEPDSEVVSYRSADELVDKVGWLMSRPAEAAKIAAAGQRRTLRDHTFGARAPYLAEIFRNAVRGRIFA
jgi:spore maturation protein CgeB